MTKNQTEWRINGAGGQNLLELRRTALETQRHLQVALEQARAMVDAPQRVAVHWEADAVVLRVPQDDPQDGPAEE